MAKAVQSSTGVSTGTLATAISERLVRKLCPDCKKERPFTEEEKEVIKKISQKYGVEFDIKNAKTYDAVGCKKCHNTGYYDRIGIFEVLDINDELKELIMSGASSIEVRKAALKGNYKPLCIDGINKVLSGLTNLEELNRKILIF